MVFKKIKESPLCKYCGSNNTCCNGLRYNKQRYVCKNCGKSFGNSDNKIKIDNREKELALLLYNRDISLRGIQNVIQYFFNNSIPTNVIHNLIKKYTKLLQIDQERKNSRKRRKTIEILEMDDLYSKYYDYDSKKNEQEKSEYGLLLTETETKLLHLK